MTIRPAEIRDVPAMAVLINDYAEQGLMLHRSHAEFYEGLRDFQVAVDDADAVVGVVALRIMWADLAECYSLAVAPDGRGQGLGQKLVAACVADAEQRGIRRVMTLTYEQRFFEKCGFHVVDRHELPLKVWSECVRCPKNQACDEIAMVRVIESVPEPEAPAPVTGEDGRFELLVPVRIRGKGQGS